MKQTIIEALRKVENNEPKLLRLVPVSGGDINEAFQAVTENGNYFIKLNSNVPSSFFQIEAEGLKQMRETGTVHVPEVHFFNQPETGQTGIFIQEWIEGERNENTEYQLGTELGSMHLIQQSKHGYPKDTFVGEWRQSNSLYENWVSYYREKRLLPQLELAAAQHRLPGQRGSNLEKVITRLDDWLDAKAPASLLHGDLWGGNWLPGKDGKAYLIDPSIFYGDRLMEISFTELFGGFSTSFYKGYKEAAPLPSHYPEVKPLYQLFYLLVHLNLFGEMYGSQVDRIIKRYS